jgi:hypothetical protein
MISKGRLLQKPPLSSPLAQEALTKSTETRETGSLDSPFHQDNEGLWKE